MQKEPGENHQQERTAGEHIRGDIHGGAGSVFFFLRESYVLFRFDFGKAQNHKQNLCHDAVNRKNQSPRKSGQRRQKRLITRGGDIFVSAGTAEDEFRLINIDESGVSVFQNLFRDVEILDIGIGEDNIAGEDASAGALNRHQAHILVSPIRGNHGVETCGTHHFIMGRNRKTDHHHPVVIVLLIDHRSAAVIIRFIQKTRICRFLNDGILAVQQPSEFRSRIVFGIRQFQSVVIPAGRYDGSLGIQEKNDTGIDIFGELPESFRALKFLIV